MVEVILHIEFSDNVDTEETAQLIQNRLSKLEMVEEVEALPDEPRLTGVEVAGAIAVGIVIIRSSREMIQELRKLIPEIKGLISDIREPKDISVEVGREELVPISQLTDAHLQQLAQ